MRCDQRKIIKDVWFLLSGSTIVSTFSPKGRSATISNRFVFIEQHITLFVHCEFCWFICDFVPQSFSNTQLRIIRMHLKHTRENPYSIYQMRFFKRFYCSWKQFTKSDKYVSENIWTRNCIQQMQSLRHTKVIPSKQLILD